MRRINEIGYKPGHELRNVENHLMIREKKNATPRLVVRRKQGRTHAGLREFEREISKVQ